MHMWRSGNATVCKTVMRWFDPSHVLQILEEGVCMKIHLDADMRSVHQRLAGKDVFRLSPENWKKFNEVLDQPPQANENLRKLLTEPSVLERQ